MTTQQRRLWAAANKLLAQARRKDKEELEQYLTARKNRTIGMKMTFSGGSCSSR